jgi:steroid delta-isomerase-like uncharacterized protein
VSEPLTSNEKRNREVIRMIFAEGWNNAEFENLGPHLAPAMTFHFRGHDIPDSLEHLKHLVANWRGAFPDLRFTIEDMLAGGERVAARLVLTGTHQGTWKDIPATGKHIRVTVMMFFRFENGLLVETWEDFDEYGMRQQLGELP